MAVVKKTLENRKTDNDRELVDRMLANYWHLRANTSIKLNFFHSNLDRFPEKRGDISDELGECFYHDIEVIEERYQEE